LRVTRPPTGSTRLAGVIGWPVRHSRSPDIHNAAYRALSLDWVYVALPVPPGQVAAALAGMSALGIEGLSVTMPHKAPVAAQVDALTSDATALGAVNCVLRDGERLVGDNTDGGGFLDSLVDAGVDPSGRRCVVLGAGGAARAVIRALAGAGADQVVVVNRDPERGRTAAELAGRRGRAGSTGDLAHADLLVQATPVGMGDDPTVAADPNRLPDGAVVADLVYHPLLTPLLAAAEARGLRTVDGLGMLVHQAARQFEVWTGAAAPVDAMRQAALG
jgi:shikimate dehydrogenase